MLFKNWKHVFEYAYQTDPYFSKDIPLMAPIFKFGKLEALEDGSKHKFLVQKVHFDNSCNFFLLVWNWCTPRMPN